MSEHAINHCDLVAEAQEAKLDRGDFMEQVLERSAQIVSERTGAVAPENFAKPHKLRAVEVTAAAVATYVIDEGAVAIARDFDVSLSDLKAHAASQHISSC